MKNFTLKENEKLTAEIIDGCAVFTIEEKEKEFKGKLIEEESKTPTLEEANKRYPVGTRFKSIRMFGNVKEVAEPFSIIDGLEIYINCTYGEACVWTPEKGWAEIIEPLFVNSHGTRFYEGDQRHYQVRKSDNTICGPYYNRSFKESSLLSEALTKEQAEQYVKDNRVFENGAYYKCVFQGENDVAMYYKGKFCITGCSNDFSIADFDSIGEKITF